MAPSTFVDMVQVAAASAGTGPLVLGAAIPTFRGTTALIDGTQYSYSIQQKPADWEYGRGVWNAATNTLSRTVIGSSNGTTPIGLLSGTPISITVLAEDFAATDQAALAAAVANAQDSADQAAGAAVQTAADRVATGQDRVQTGSDRMAADADAASTAADRIAVHADRVAADADAVATAADRVQTSQDRTATHTDRLAADADAAATAADRTATHTDRLAADADATQTAADRVSTTASASQAQAAVNAAATSAATAATQAGIATAAATSPGFQIQGNPATPTVPPSGVASGSTYWAVDPSSTNLVLYTNSAGTGVAVSPTVKISILQLVNSYPGAIEFALLDPNGYPWLAVTPNAFRHQFIDALVARTAALETFATHFPNIAVAGYPEFSLTDPNGYPWLRATPTNLQHPTIDTQGRNINAALRGAPDPTVADMRNIAERIGLHMSGESLSLGHGSAPLYSTTPSTISDMFGNAALTAASIVPEDLSNYITGPTDPNLIANRAALTSAYETVKNPGSPDWTSHYETPLSGCAQVIKQLLADEDGIDFSGAGMRFLLADDGRNGGSIGTEDETGTGYTAQRVYASMGQGQTLYATQNKSYMPAAQLLMTGTNDNASDSINYPGGASTKWFYNRAVTVQAQRQAKARQIVGGTFRLPLLIGQTATHTNPSYYAPIPHVALDQLQLAIDKQEFLLACIQYACQNNVNDVHLTGAGSKLAGAYYGLHLKRLMFDGIRLGPLVPTFRAQGSQIIAYFPVRPGHKIMGGLTVADTTVLSNWGVAAIDANGTSQTLSNPRVVGRDRIVWDAPAAPANTWKFRCGYTGNNNKAWTNIGESRADSTLIFDPNWLRLPMYRWLPICEVPLS